VFCHGAARQSSGLGVRLGRCRSPENRPFQCERFSKVHATVDTLRHLSALQVTGRPHPKSTLSVALA
jgi:hypothetical protein